MEKYVVLCILTAAATGRQFVKVIVFLLGKIETLLFDIVHLAFVLQLILCRGQVVAEHLLLYALPLLARILKLCALCYMVDIVASNIRVVRLLPAHRQLVAHTILKRLRFCVAARRIKTDAG